MRDELSSNSEVSVSASLTCVRMFSQVRRLVVVEWTALFDIAGIDLKPHKALKMKTKGADGRGGGTMHVQAGYPVLLSVCVCVCREWSVWSSSHHFAGSGPEACSWNQSAIHTAEGETWTPQQVSSDQRNILKSVTDQTVLLKDFRTKFLIDFIINLDGSSSYLVFLSLLRLAY